MTNKKFGDFDAATADVLVGTEEFLVAYTDNITCRMAITEFAKFAMSYVQSNFVWDALSDASIGWSSSIFTVDTNLEVNTGTYAEGDANAFGGLHFGPVTDFAGATAFPEIHWVPVTPGDGSDRPTLEFDGSNWKAKVAHASSDVGLFAAVPGTLTIRYRVNGALTKQKLILAIGNFGDTGPFPDPYPSVAWSHAVD